ncbi:MAG: cadherin-like domain-containing protein, partial [Candidatus Thorarchaeota archaeon]|nr:cadherin-like domain-containing protein [Candidatus Thorarchaeota archaeon]
MIINKKICLFAIFLAFIVTLLSASPLLINDLVDNSACITSDGFSSSYSPFQAAVTPTGNPEAEDDSYTIYEDNPLMVLAPGVLGNDHDVDGDPLIAILDTMPSQGSLTFFDDGSFIYIPAPNFFGVDFFTYHASDFLLDSNIATVMIEVLPVNDAPVALDDEFVMYEDTSLTIPAPLLLSNDNDPDGDFSLAVIDSFPSFGLLEIVSDQEFIYTPFPDWYGIDSFSYRITDGIEYSSVAVVTIIVLDVIDDTTPPTTTISLAGTLGANGWYISDVVVTLTATDDLSTFSTMYSLDDTNWFSYTGPFTITADG